MNEKQPIPLRLLGAWVGSYLSAPLLRIYAGAGRRPYCYEAQSELLYPFRRCARTI